MAKFTPDVTLDKTLEDIALADKMYVCSGQPANFAGIAAVALADVVLTPGSGNGDFTIGNGDVSGRKVNVAQQPTIPIDSSGDATHIVLAIDASSRMVQVTTCTLQPLTAGGTVTVPTYDVEILDPS